MSDWNNKLIAEFRENDGTAGRFGRGLVVMHTIGAKSGEVRLVPAAGFRNDDGWLVIASAAGAPKHPDWYYNLAKNPEFDIEAAKEVEGVETIRVTATELEDADYPAAWSRITTQMPGFLEYEKTTEGRRMPIFQLSPTA
jgi:deazaflavin-dependent oxidoreductase (nitroreductase family)